MNDFGLNPTNSFFTANFDVLKANGVEDPLVDVSRLATLDLDESYTAIANEFVSEMNTAMANAKIEFYNAISEATTEFDIQESFIGLVGYISGIIKKVIKFITDLAGKASAKLMQKTHNYQFLMSHEKDFKAFKDDMAFNTEGYTFSFDPNIPRAEALIAFNQNLFSDLYCGLELSAQDIKDANSAANVSDNKYDIFRAQVLGIQGKAFNVNEYPIELFRVYRSGATDGTTTSLYVDKKYVSDAFNRLKDRSQLKKQIDTGRSDAEKEYNKILDTVKKVDEIINGRNVDLLVSNMPTGFNVSPDDINNGREMSADFAAQLNIYVQNKVAEIQQYSTIHIQAFSAKLDAIQSCFVQDMNTLYQAYNIVKGYENREED